MRCRREVCPGVVPRFSNPGSTSWNPFNNSARVSVSLESSPTVFESSPISAAKRTSACRLSCTYTLSSDRVGALRFVASRVVFTARASKISGGARVSGELTRNECSVRLTQSGTLPPPGASNTRHRSKSCVRVSTPSRSWSARSSPNTARCAAASKNAYANSWSSFSRSKLERRVGWRWNARSTACVVDSNRRRRGASMSLSTSGVIRLKGNKQCGARACSTPLARDPVSNSVSSRSWCASQKSFSSEAPTKGDAPCVSPRAGSRVS
mmetsp:Transcript_1898/g.7204  ORF Transcript_1898/g.7204 Transcript_1898/m.7204 type:complete len:267 (-) Transcript_1898:103-903(-)